MNDLTITNLQTTLPEPDLSRKQPTEATESPFSDYVKRSLEDVNRQMLDADRAVDDLVTGREQNIHETMIAMKKAEISFELVMQIRNKLMAAYDEIRKMPI